MRRKRWLGWLTGIFIVLALMACAAHFVLRSGGFHRYAMSKIVEQANEATGGRVELQGFDFSLRTLTAHLYGLTLHGTENPSEKPLLQVDKITVGIKIQSLLRRSFSLNELVVQRPVVHLVVDKNGTTNLPEPPPQRGGAGNTNVFDMAVRRTLLSNGEVYCNDKRNPVEADLRDLRAEVHFDFLSSGYVGSISYDNGYLHFASYSPFSHGLNLQFSATPSGIALNPLLLKVDSSTIALRVRLTNYSQPQIDGSYEVHVHTQDLASLSQSAKPAGDVVLSGTLQYQSSPGRSVIQALRADGQMRSDGLTASSSEGNLVVTRLQGHYQLGDGVLRSRDIAIDALDGHIAADLTVEHLDATPQVRVRAAMQRISLEALRASLRERQLPNLRLVGTLEGKADAFWAGSTNSLRASSLIDIRAIASNAANRAARPVPMNGTVHIDYNGSRNVIHLEQTSLQTASSSITLQGDIGDHSNLQIRCAARDLRQVAILAAAIEPAPQEGEKPFDISGSALVQATMQGSPKAPHFSGSLSTQNLQTRHSQWRNASLTFTASPSQVVLQNVSLVNAHQGTIAATARIALSDWAYSPSNQIAANLSIRQMDIADLQHLAGTNYSVAGDLGVDLSLSGSQLNPSGHGNAAIANARIYGEPFQTLALKMDAANASLNSTINAKLPAGLANIDLHYSPKTKAYSFKLSAPAITLEKLQTVQARNLDLTGTVNASASGEGTLDHPKLSATVQMARLQLRQTTMSGMSAKLDVADDRANLSLNCDVAQAHVQGHGSVNLVDGYYADLALDTNRIPLGPLLALYWPGLPENFQGQTEFHGTLKGPLWDKSQIEAHVTIPLLTASYQTLQLESAQPIRADYAHSLFTLQPAEIRGTGTSLKVQGTIPLNETGEIKMIADGSVDVRILQLVQPDIKSSGVVTLNVRTSGTVNSSAVQGQIHFQDVAVSTSDTPLGLEKLNGDIDLTHEKLQIRSLTGQVGGGQVSAGGSVTYRPALLFNLAIQGKDVRLRYPEGVRTLLDTNLALSGTRQESTLTGQVLIDSLSFTPDFDMAQFASQFNGTSAPSTGAAFADSVKLAVSVQSTQNLSANSSQLNLEGTANLRVIGTAAEPVIIGRTDLTSGELFFLSNRYKLDHGFITFNNTGETEPVLDLALTTTIEQYNLTLSMKGPIDRLRTTYVSDPPLATADIINLIARGQTTEEAGGTDTGADSILAGQVAGQITGGIQKLAGISSLQIDPLIGGSNQNPSARVALQQRVTKNLLFTFSTDVTQPGTEILQGDYQIDSRWSVSVARDQLGGVSADGRFHTKF